MDFPAAVRRLSARSDVERVCDLGGGANPILSLDDITEHRLRYELVDASAEELAKAPTGYTTVQANALDPAVPEVHGPYDVVASRFIAEHVQDAERFHRNVFALLRPGGYAAHMFPTLYEPVFVLNRVIPEGLANALLRLIQPGREEEGPNPRFRAYYRWCRGPTPRQLRRLRNVGFEVVEYTGYFGHNYFQAIRPVHAVEQRVAAALLRRPVPSLTSYAVVVLRRPA